jgi:hypothetical protein
MSTKVIVASVRPSATGVFAREGFGRLVNLQVPIQFTNFAKRKTAIGERAYVRQR